MANLISETTVKSKSKFKLPEGAEVISKSERIYVEEIENGFLISKDYEIKWKDADGENHWDNFSRKWSSEKNPITINETKGMKSLSDNF